MKKKELEPLLKVGVTIQIGKKSAKKTGYKAGETLTLIEGHFEYYNGLYYEDQKSPSVWNEQQKDFDSIYHIFGNDLEDFSDSKIIS